MSIVGPGAISDDVAAPKPLLEGASEYEWIELYNPLTDDFAVKVALDVPVNIPFEIRDKSRLTQTESDVRTQYGLDLKNPDHQATKKLTSNTVIKSGTTHKFKGNEAQTAIKQLVNEILQREGRSRFMADPTVRRQVEERIVVSRGSIQDLMDDNLQTVQSQLNKTLERANELKDEPFPGLREITKDAESDPGIAGDGATTPQKRSPGRPKSV